MSALLQARELEIAFGGIRALCGVDFAVDVGESVGIIGPNGSGKTTLLHVLSGFLRPSKGRVAWKGTDVTEHSVNARVRLGLIRSFQDVLVFPGILVSENLQIACDASRRLHSGNWSSSALAEYVGIMPLLDRTAGTLSWGQARLVGIALALSHEPSLLLLDEPFAGLSPVAVEQVQRIVSKIHADGTALCIVDHQVEYLREVCGRLVVLFNGECLVDGTADAVLADPRVHAAYLGAADD